MESPSDRGSPERDSALLRIQNLGTTDGGPKAARGRGHAVGCVERNVAQSDTVRLDGSIPESSANRETRPSSLEAQSQTAQSVEWSAHEQRDVGNAEAAVKIALADANREYERRFDRIFMCAPQAGPQRRFWRFFGDALRTTPKLTFRKQPSSSGRLQKSGYGNGFRMKRISTHILDMVVGKPATPVSVRLEKQNLRGDWLLLTTARTDQDGRCAQLLPEGEIFRRELSFDL